MGEKVVICVPNWLGDSIMSMPAVQRYRILYPENRITVLVKEALAGLWRMQSAADDVISFQPSLTGTFSAAGRIRAGGFDQAYVFPNSFRSALMPFAAGVPRRTGARGHWRSNMLTNIVRTGRNGYRPHQAWEYCDILGVSGEMRDPGVPELSLPAGAEETRRRMREETGPVPWAAIMPGAARGPSKRWPAGRFAETGRQLVKRKGCMVLVFGTDEDRAACREVARGAGGKARDLSGKTSLEDAAALLGDCVLAVTNDSGGMHLAAAAGTSVAAVFGTTDPDRTGPLGRGHRIVSVPGAPKSRDIKPGSVSGRRYLEAIAPEAVTKAAIEVFENNMKK
ncbi:MAG: lipopolysaccharide heptosyltransferase II [Kiritimatiellia bacterium]